MDSRLRGNDEVVGCSLLGFVIPVQTGIHVFRVSLFPRRSKSRFLYFPIASRKIAAQARNHAVFFMLKYGF